MGFLKRRSRLELAALVVLLGTIAAILVVVTGVLHQGRATSASRVTALCRPIATAIEHDDPAQMTIRDMLRLKQETVGVADGLGAVIKDARRPVRRPLLQMRNALYTASDRDGVLTIRQRAEFLGFVGDRAASIGASCPSPLTVAEGRIVDQTLGPRTP